MNPQSQYQNSIAGTSSMDNHEDRDQHAADTHLQRHPCLDYSVHNFNDQKVQNIVNTEACNRDHCDHDNDHNDPDQNNNLENTLNYEVGPLYCTDNNPPESYAVCQAKVSDWLNQNTYMERKASVKFAITKNLDPCQTGRSTHRKSVSLHQRPKLSIIGFRKKPVQQTEGSTKSRQNDKAENIRLFRNRSEPGRDYCLLITEPVSPRVSCVGRVGSVRVQGKKAGVWKSFKAVFSNMVQTSRVQKITA